MPDEETRARLAARYVTIEVAPIVGLEGEAPGLAGVRLADARLSRSWLYTLRRARASRVRSPNSWALHWTTARSLR